MKRSRSKFLCMLFAILMCLSVVPFTAFAAETADEFASELVSEGLSMTPGASIRLSEDYGIRFETKIDRAFFDTWGEENVLEVGMIVAPTKYIGDREFSEASLAEGQYLRVKSSGYAEETVDGKTFRVALVGFKDSAEAFTTAFSARAYAVVKDERDGKNLIYYSAYDPANARSLADVALGCKGSGEYDDNSIINHILNVVDADYTWLQNPDNTQGRKPGEVAKLKLDSFEFTAENVGDIKPHNLDVVRVQTNTFVQVGQQIEFDYTWLATNNHAENNNEYDQGWGEFYFWLKDASRSFNEGYYNTFKMQNRSGLPKDAQSAGFFNCAETGIYGGGCAGFVAFGQDSYAQCACMCREQVNYHFTVAVHPGENGNAPMVNVTVTESKCPNGKAAHSYTFTRAGALGMKNIALVFGSARLSYRISNMKVGDIPSRFSRTDWSNSNKIVSFEKDAFQYTGEMVSGDYLYESFVTSNQELTVGQKVEFDYEMLDSADGGEAYFWIKEPHEPIRDWNNDNFVNFGLKLAHTGDSRALQMGVGGIHPDTVAFDGTEGVKKFHVVIELLSGTDGQVEFKCTVTELGVENPVSRTYSTQRRGSARMALVFGASHLSYRISNLSASNAQ